MSCRASSCFHCHLPPVSRPASYSILFSRSSDDDLQSSCFNPFSREYFTDQVEGIDVELSWLRDQLTSGGLNIDPGSLSGVGIQTAQEYY